MGGAAQAGNKLASIPTCCKPQTKEDLTKRLTFSRPEILEV